ncbi:mRNA interferase MazF [Algoriphagus alkaliphilus]|uniref:mRNA interferase n=1 Tax=Algoriphagus alkaliphilus TaxID=279824 RepID=A0A1G5ZNQ4_9BACT|nr:type II toxin-antitoxin system PemK/MazF family toxin [Algoriphagus alkaliphilus]MBA4300040.1 type II toxin-antitoxin system PemK/MazF family toxin [Cyclobacterium sp.]SDA96156.1 mRNA interferase MazF [Algoriphagus alkaliphilus]
MEIIQYQIVLVNLDPTLGYEIKKTRPCVVISPNEMNQYLKTIVIAPMTSSEKSYPSRIPVLHNGKKGMIALDQIRSIDKLRVQKLLDRLSTSEIESLKSLIKETFVD